MASRLNLRGVLERALLMTPLLRRPEASATSQKPARPAMAVKTMGLARSSKARSLSAKAVSKSAQALPQGLDYDGRGW